MSSDADKFAEMDTKHDMCDQFPCRECIAELNICPGCGDYLYDGDVNNCQSCVELLEAIAISHKKRNQSDEVNDKRNRK